MEKQKTAMSVLIAHVEGWNRPPTIQDILDKATELLDKESGQIIDAFRDGNMDNSISANNYFTQKYQTNE